jgi:predicted PurR-regulated permease PerM
MKKVLEFLQTLWRYWKRFADFILETVFQCVLLVFYFTVFMPFALVFKFLDKDTFQSGWRQFLKSKAEDLY